MVMLTHHLNARTLQGDSQDATFSLCMSVSALILFLHKPPPHVHILSWYILTYCVGKVWLYFYVLMYRVLSEQEIDERLLAIADQD